jgi:MFS family permease
MGNGLLGTLLAVGTVQREFPVVVTGAVMAAYSVGFIAGSLRCVAFISHAGHIRTFAALASVASAAALAHILVDNALVWAVLRMIAGFCFAGLYMVIESWLNEVSDNRNRGQVLSVYMMLSLGAMAAGQLLMLTPDPGGFELYCIASILISLGLVPVTLSRSSAPAPHPPALMKLSALYRTSPLGIAGSFASGLALGAFWAMAPVFCRMIGLSENVTAVFMASTIVGGLVLLWPMGRLSDRLDRRTIIMLACGASALVSLAIILTTDSRAIVLFGLAAVWGGFTFPIYSLSVAHTNDFLEQDSLVAASSGLLMVYGAGAIMGPLLAGVTMTFAGPAGLYATLAGLMVLFAQYRRMVGESVPVAEQGDVVLLPRTTPVAYGLDPRVEAAAPQDD